MTKTLDRCILNLASAALACMILALLWMMAGCEGLPPRTYSLGYTDERGRSLNAGLTLGDTRLPQPKGLAK